VGEDQAQHKSTGAAHMDLDAAEQVLVVIPAFNEGTVIGDVVRDVLTQFPEVVVIDDGSSDSTTESARTAGAHVLTHPVNLGQGAALLTGFAWGALQGRFKLFATFDADGQHQVEDLVRAVVTQRTSGVDIVLGSRFLKREGTIPWSKKVLLRLAIAQSRLSSGLKITDTHNGLRVCTADFARDLRLSDGMAHASDFLHEISRQHRTMCEVPVTVRYTAYSRAKGQPMMNAVNILFDSFIGPR